MEISTDISLKGPIWAECLERLKPTFFESYWDVYSLCISIGIMYDKQISNNDMEPDDYTAEALTVPRTVLSKAQNLSLLEFMFQAALVTTKNLDFDEDTRLKFAFGSKKTGVKKNDEPSVEEEMKALNFNPMNFLTTYANYGITKIHEIITDSDDLEIMESLMTFLNNAYENSLDVISDIDILDDNDDYTW
jgi:hypothetical protein